MTHAAEQTSARIGRAGVRVAICLTALIAVSAFTLSFMTLTDLAEQAGLPPSFAWLWPVTVDGMIVAATVASVALVDQPARARRYAAGLLIFGAAVSVTSNGVHAAVHVVSSVPVTVAIAIASFPPVALLASTHLTVVLTRRSQKRSTRAQRTVRASAVPPPPVAPSASETTALPGVAAPSQLEASAPARRKDADEKPSFATWVAMQESTGVKVTGPMAADFLEVSAPTARRRLAELRSAGGGE